MGIAMPPAWSAPGAGGDMAASLARKNITRIILPRRAQGAKHDL
jgi:hypothetical protein